MRPDEPVGPREWAAMDWDRVAAGHGRHRMARVLHRIPPGGRHLDLGTGKGDGTVQLIPRTRCVGVEYGMTSLLAAAELGCRMVQADGRDLPFARGTFDSVSLLDVLEHIPRPHDALAEVARVLRPGGLLVLQTPNRELFKERALRLVRRLGHPQRQPYDVPLGLLELRDLIAGAGLVLEHESPIRCWDPRLLVRAFSWSRLFLCRKPS